MNLHNHLLEQIPNHVIAAMSAGAASAVALADVAWQALTGQIPGPEQAGQWSFYGVLIVAIIVLFTSLASVVWWGATKALKAFQDLAAALNRVNDTLEKQNDYFDEVAVNAVRSALTSPPPHK